MSFDVNVLRTMPVIRETANMNNDGGGGNLGYMQQEQDETKGRKQKLNESIFGKKEEDVFIGKENIKIPEDEFSFTKWLGKIIDKIVKLVQLRK